MKGFDFIFKMTLSDDGQDMIARPQAEVISPCLKFDKSLVFEIQNRAELNQVITNITLIYHSTYFKINRQPVFVFNTEELETSFLKEFRPLGLGDIISINREKENQTILKPAKEVFSNYFDFNTKSKSLYFISKEAIEFTDWKNSLDQKLIPAMVKNLSLTLKIINQENVQFQLKLDLNLLNESLNAIKNEYSKEIDWYKKELVQIKEWYEHENKKNKNWHKEQFGHLPLWYVKLGKIFKLVK